MERTLQLTSPLMRGSDVAYARRLLHPEYLVSNPGLAQDRFDTAAATASKRAKWELGYPESKCTPTFGTTLERLLLGHALLPITFRVRAAQRKKYLTTSAKAVDEALRWVGKTEQPAGSNIIKPFTEWYGWIGWGAPWCAVFTSYCLDKAGFKYIDPKASRWAYVPYVLADARAGRYGLRLCSENQVAKGTLVLFDWDNDGVPDHIGFATGPVDLRVGTVPTVEGNTSSSDAGSQSNGGGVYQRTRRLTDIIAFVQAG